MSVAKAWIGPHATELIQDCVQLHGGIGVTWEHDLHLYLRRATVNRVTYGTPEEHAERIATRAAGRRRRDASSSSRSTDFRAATPARGSPTTCRRSTGDARRGDYQDDGAP